MVRYHHSGIKSQQCLSGCTKVNMGLSNSNVKRTWFSNFSIRISGSLHIMDYFLFFILCKNPRLSRSKFHR